MIAEPPPRTALEGARLIASGRLTSEQLVRSYLRRAKQRENDLRAWSHLAELEAVAESRQRDRETPKGLLHGVPVGIKDLSDTADMPTGYGSAAYAGHRPPADAACVALARSAGAVILGKTSTTEFGGSEPTPTRNPHNPAHTPGGSSSGSAAAVADGQVPLATGTQTGGSVIRPASFCGVVGFKPSFGSISLYGTRSPSWSLDTLGLFAADIDDVALFFAALRGEQTLAERPPPQHRPTVGVFLGPYADRAELWAIEALETVAELCSALGCRVANLTAPAGFDRSLDWQRTISRFETSRSLTFEWTTKRHSLGAPLKADIRQGLPIAFSEYEQAKTESSKLAAAVHERFTGYDLVLTLAATGEAPLGLRSTGDAAFNRSWTLLGLPCLALPAALGPHGLPLAVQAIGARHRDDELLAHASWLQYMIRRQGLYPD
ncbi:MULTISPECIES: amidase [unclassified Streptomyces]|uniref:amidase n=1 Tax=unclassified Streptomyces TaxID=2593676 RepID=UPI00070DE61B|nr:MULTISPECIES: amidase [unclassified Streptomyces]KQV93511.1 hypothetical protein ASD08_15825 [Streptomyces sp. Root369]